MLGSGARLDAIFGVRLRRDEHVETYCRSYSALSDHVRAEWRLCPGRTARRRARLSGWGGFWRLLSRQYKAVRALPADILPAAARRLPGYRRRRDLQWAARLARVGPRYQCAIAA